MRICVFCGSKNGSNAAYSQAAYDLGRKMAQLKIDLVYGGASNGLMGVIANEVLNAKGTVIGVIPKNLKKEVHHLGISDLFVVDSMPERKAAMIKLADGFIVLPGGIGTCDELFEIWTLTQLSSINKPFVLLNVDGYYDNFIRFIDDMRSDGFLSDSSFSLLKICHDPTEAISICQLK
tara:strand:- start:283 stop:816 length:534 start_codon:yes stop_codon:yes gene_type:complete